MFGLNVNLFVLIILVFKEGRVVYWIRFVILKLLIVSESNKLLLIL